MLNFYYKFHTTIQWTFRFVATCPVIYTDTIFWKEEKNNNNKTYTHTTVFLVWGQTSIYLFYFKIRKYKAVPEVWFGKHILLVFSLFISNKVNVFCVFLTTLYLHNIFSVYCNGYATIENSKSIYDEQCLCVGNKSKV